jgi:hypothetical protein
VRVLGGESVRVLVHVERADQDRAGGLEPRDGGRVGRGGVCARAIALDA